VAVNEVKDLLLLFFSPALDRFPLSSRPNESTSALSAVAGNHAADHLRRRSLLLFVNHRVEVYVCGACASKGSAQPLSMNET
jgi:predicted RNA polymerase sigma factor